MATLAELSEKMLAVSRGDIAALSSATAEFARNVTQLDHMPHSTGTADSTDPTVATSSSSSSSPAPAWREPSRP